jgi:hypothetical protein
MLTLLALQMASKRPDGDETERAFSELLTLRPDLDSICTPELAAVVAEEAAALSADQQAVFFILLQLISFCAGLNTRARWRAAVKPCLGSLT